LTSLSRIDSKTGDKIHPRQYKIDPKSHGVWFSFNQLGVVTSGGGRSASLSYQYGNPQPLWQDARAHDGGYRFPGWNISGEHTNQAKKSFNFQLSQYKFQTTIIK